MRSDKNDVSKATSLRLSVSFTAETATVYTSTRDVFFDFLQPASKAPLNFECAETLKKEHFVVSTLFCSSS